MKLLNLSINLIGILSVCMCLKIDLWNYQKVDLQLVSGSNQLQSISCRKINRIQFSLIKILIFKYLLKLRQIIAKSCTIISKEYLQEFILLMEPKLYVF
jgi:hypothetical protein